MERRDEIVTDRLRLRRFTRRHAAAFAAMHGDPFVMHDYPAPLTRAQSDAKLADYRSGFKAHGYGRWAIETPDGAFIGYAGIQQIWPDFPLPGSREIGWRLTRSAWGNGYATEAAAAALRDGRHRCGVGEVMAFTEATNRRSEAVMHRLGMARRAQLDFRLPGSGAPCIVYAA